MNLITKIYSKIYNADSVQTTFNEDSIDELGGEAENVISNTNETTKEE
jgi:hypothetical protein